MFALQQIRKIKGVKRCDLAKASGINLQTILALENGINNPNQAKIGTLIALAKALKCKVRDFYPDEKCI